MKFKINELFVVTNVGAESHAEFDSACGGMASVFYEFETLN